ncbi:hypothetical protein WJX73_002921 [Symbiochloris irregularis]|uniref:1-(5-phosphoribosyl)-5-[(5-phosphoribosylamino)methylideneamino] imidazole-4-carboxamide isomerase HISN3, chloroplastic n=1 Tax=Symbiochloris irregularis TaxID=706552 RepID=A0AAW1PU97_9CHLO
MVWRGFASRDQHSIAFRPCIDIHKGKVKQIVGSTLRDLPQTGSTPVQPQTNFESEFPAQFYANLYQECNLTGGHVIILGADAASKNAAFEALQAYPGGLQLGGGVSPSNAFAYLDAGASHVIVTSYVFREGHLDAERLKEMVSAVGKERLVLDLSCRRRDGTYYVVTDRWQRFSELAVDEVSLQELAKSCSEFLVHGVDVEGKRLGIDEELVALLGQSSPIPVTYAGGASSMADLEQVRAAGKGQVDVTVGSALDIFGGSLPFADVMDWHRQHAGAAP